MNIRVLLIALLVYMLWPLFGCQALMSGQPTAETPKEVDQQVAQFGDRVGIITKGLDDAGVTGTVLAEASGRPAEVYAKQSFGVTLPVDWRITILANLQPKQVVNELARANVESTTEADGPTEKPPDTPADAEPQEALSVEPDEEPRSG